MQSVREYVGSGEELAQGVEQKDDEEGEDICGHEKIASRSTLGEWMGGVGGGRERKGRAHLRERVDNLGRSLDNNRNGT